MTARLVRNIDGKNHYLTHLLAIQNYFNAYLAKIRKAQFSGYPYQDSKKTTSIIPSSNARDGMTIERAFNRSLGL